MVGEVLASLSPASASLVEQVPESSLTECIKPNCLYDALLSSSQRAHIPRNIHSTSHPTDFATYFVVSSKPSHINASTMTAIGSWLKALIATITIAHCHAAVTWTKDSCDGVTIRGESLDAIWDNARDMAANAASQIQKLMAADAIIPMTDLSQIADNAKDMFGIDFTFTRLMGLSSDAQKTMKTVKGTMPNDLPTVSRMTRTCAIAS